MAFTVGAIAAKDGSGTLIPGGLLAADIAGGNVGPFFLFQGLVDGVAGVNKAGVTSSNELKVADASLLAAIAGVAFDAPAGSVNPSLIGGYGVVHGTQPTAVSASLDATRFLTNRVGIPFMLGGHPNILSPEFTVLASDGAQANLALISVSSGAKIVITSISALMSASNSVAVNCRIGFAAATLPSAALSGAAGMLISGKFAAAATAGHQRGAAAGIVAIGGDGEDLRLTCDSPTGGDIRILVSYFTIES